MTSVLQLVKQHPDWSSRQIAETYGRNIQYVRECRSRMKRPEHYREMHRKMWKRHYKKYAAEHGIRPRAEITWPDKDLAYLKKWYSDKSASQIGRHLGRTKNAVIGMAHRMGLRKVQLSDGHAQYFERYRRDIAEINAHGGGVHVVDR